jgi:hypothetical protein
MAEYEDHLCDENRETLPDFEYRREQAAAPEKGQP